MVNQNMLRTHQGKKDLSVENKNPICDCFRPNQMPYTVKIAEIAHLIRTHF